MRQSFWARGLAALVGTTLWGCAAPKPAPMRAPSASAGFSDHALSAAAESARARASLATSEGSAGVVSGVQLRARGLSARDLQDGQNASAGVRVLLERPWQVSAESKSSQAEHQAASFVASAAELRARALTCDESVQGRAMRERQQLATTHTAALERVLAWTVAFRDAGSLDPITASRTELLVQRKLLGAVELDESLRVHDTLGALPELAAVGEGALDRDPERVAERIRAQHPNVQAHVAAAEQQRQRSSAEMGKRLPWLNFVELDYGLDGQGPRDIEGRLSLEIPLDDGSRGRAQRYAELGASEDYEAQSEAALLTQQALVALRALHAFHTQAPKLAELQARADQAEQLALRFVEERREGPDRVAQLLDESQAGRLFVLAARERAGRASCSLEWATGLSYAAWPRRSP